MKIGTLVTTLLFRMDEPNPRPEDIYKRPEELFNHPKPPKNYVESQSPPNNKKRQRFQSNLGSHRGKKPWQVGVQEIHKIAMITKQPITMRKFKLELKQIGKTKTNTKTKTTPIAITNNRLDHHESD